MGITNSEVRWITNNENNHRASANEMGVARHVMAEGKGVVLVKYGAGRD